MQILSNALPGFRDLRSPLITGYLWLLFVWLLAQPEFDRHSTGLGGAIYDLGQKIGDIGLAAAIGVGAYLVGAVSQIASDTIREVILLYGVFGLWSANFMVPLEDQLKRIRTRGQLQLEVASQGIPGPMFERFEIQLGQRHEEAIREGGRELDLPATLLVGEQNELFAEVDRLRAEGELRMSVSFPLAAIGVLLAIESSLWWLFLLPAVSLLFMQGAQRYFLSKKIIADASENGHVKASSIGKFSTWVDEVLPAEIARAQGLPTE